MKTAMQELLGLVEQMFTNAKTKEVELAMNDVINIITQVGIEKEKEHLIDAWEKGYSTGCVVGSNDYTNEDEEKDNGNYYYNQTYNQNK